MKDIFVLIIAIPFLIFCFGQMFLLIGGLVLLGLLLKGLLYAFLYTIYYIKYRIIQQKQDFTIDDITEAVVAKKEDLSMIIPFVFLIFFLLSGFIFFPLTEVFSEPTTILCKKVLGSILVGLLSLSFVLNECEVGPLEGGGGGG